MYPKVILTRPIRRAIMGFLILCFFIISPLTLLYTAGYRYDFKNNKIQYTGVISIDIKTDDAHIILNGVKKKKNKPHAITQRVATRYRFANIRPGIHHVGIVKTGYKTWEQDVEVRSNRTTYIKGFELIKENALAPFLPAASTTIAVIPSFDGSYLALVDQTDSVYDIRLHHKETNKTETILRKISDTEPIVSWSPFRNHLAIITEEKNTVIFSLLQAHDPNRIRTHSLSRQFFDGVWQWQRIAGLPRIYVETGNGVLLLTDQEEQIVAADVGGAWYAEDQHVMWIFDEKKSVLQKYMDGTRADSYESAFPIQGIIAIYPTHLIVETAHDIKTVRLNNERVIPLGAVSGALAKQTRYNHALKKEEWIAWSDWEVWNIEEDGKTNLAYRASEPIRHVFPLNTYGMLLLQFEKSLVAFNPGYYVSQTLTEGYALQNIGVYTEEQEVYFGKEDDGYYTLAL